MANVQRQSMHDIAPDDTSYGCMKTNELEYETLPSQYINNTFSVSMDKLDLEQSTRTRTGHS